MSDITETKKLGEGYDQPSEAVKQTVDQTEEQIDREGDDHPGEHWSDLNFIKLAIALAAVTALEVAMSYTIDFWGPLFIPVLLLLMAVKFFAVVLYFMHLKFDNRLFGLMFYLGLFLAISVYVGAMLTFRFFD